MKTFLFFIILIMATVQFSNASCNYLATDDMGCDVYWCPNQDPTQSCAVIRCEGSTEMYCAS